MSAMERPSWDDRKDLLDIWQQHAPIPDIGLREGIFDALIAVAGYAFDRAAETGVVAEEPEWEFGWKSHFPNGEEYEWLACDSREDAERQIRTNQDDELVSGYEDDERLAYSLWKRTKSKAGPWIPVES